MDRDARHTIVAWWLFMESDSIGPFEPSPEWIAEKIAYAEENAATCNEILANEYEEYVPQRTDSA